MTAAAARGKVKHAVKRLVKSFDVKTSQLMLFGILLALMGDAARLHAVAARRAGASWEELHAVVGLAYLFRGMPAANLGAEVLLKMAEAEGHAAPA